MPRAMVTTQPPGSFPGMRILAMTPATRPKTIQDNIPMGSRRVTDFGVVTNRKRLVGVLPRAAAIAALFVLAGCGNVVVEATGGDPGTGGAGGSAMGGSGGDGGAGGSTTTSGTSSTTTSSTETTCGCVVDENCPDNLSCFACECVECTPSSGDEECGPGLWCCGKSCEDLGADPQNVESAGSLRAVPARERGLRGGALRDRGV